MEAHHHEGAGLSAAAPQARRDGGPLRALPSALSLVPALALRTIVDQLTRPHGSFGSVLGVIALAMLAAFAAGLLGVASTYLTLSISEDIVEKVRSQLFDHLLSESVGYFTRRRAGEAIRGSQRRGGYR